MWLIGFPKCEAPSQIFPNPTQQIAGSLQLDPSKNLKEWIYVNKKGIKNSENKNEFFLSYFNSRIKKDMHIQIFISLWRYHVNYIIRGTNFTYGTVLSTSST